MKCASCDTANPDSNEICMQCGESLKAPAVIPIEPASHSTEVVVEVGKKNVNDYDGIEDVGPHTIIANTKTDEKKNAPTSSEDAVPVPEPTQVEKTTTSDVQEDPPSITNEPTPLAQPIGLPEESHAIIEEVSTQIASTAPIEQELTQISTQTIPELMLQEEQTIRRQQDDVIFQDPIVAPVPPSDAPQPDIPAIADIPQIPIPSQIPPMYPGPPLYPGQPVPGGMYPSAPSYPGYPSAQVPNVYPSGVSGEYPPINAYQPGMSGEYPPMREYPPMPGSFANQTTGHTIPGYPYSPAIARPQTAQQLAGLRQIASIAKPLPIWILVISTVATLAILAALQLTGGDWADGAMRAAIGAISIAVLLLLFAGIRVFLGMFDEANKKRVAQSIGSALAIVLLFVYSGLALVGQNLLHTAQAHFLEGRKQWQQAINEYQLGGEVVPTSINLARTYDEWGEALNQSGRYTDAISKFNLVLNDYTTPNEIARAQKDDATAYYNLAQLELNAQQYNDAVSNFKTLQSRFASSPEAQRAHAPLATALLGMGKQERANVCSSAIPTYEDLATSYSDTPEGQNAASELSQPQPVSGHFTSTLPTDGVLTVVLTTTPLNGNMSGDEAGSIIRNSPITTSINSDGTFKFGPQHQGTYDLAWVDTTPTTIESIFYFKPYTSSKDATYVANVIPLCPFNFGDITSAFKPS